MPKFKLPVTWSVCAEVEVEADSLQDAVDRFDELTDHIPLPESPEYVDGSFELSEYDVHQLLVYQDENAQST